MPTVSLSLVARPYRCFGLSRAYPKGAMMCFTRRSPCQVLLVALSVLVLLSSCTGSRQARRRHRQGGVPAQPQSFLPVYDQVTPFVESQNFSGALSALEHGEAQFGKKDRLLYLMERGLLSLYTHDYTISRKTLTEAEILDEELYTKSLTRQARVRTLSRSCSTCYWLWPTCRRGA